MAQWPPPIEGSIKSWFEQEAHGLLAEARLEYPLRLPRGAPECGADLGIVLPSQLIFLEVDNSGTPVDTNVSKYWPWLEAQRLNKPVLLIHILNPVTFTGKSYSAHVMIARYIAEQITKAWPAFRYVQINGLPPADTWYQEAIRRAKELIQPHLQAEREAKEAPPLAEGKVPVVTLSGAWRSFVTESPGVEKHGEMILRQVGERVEGIDRVEEADYRLSGRIDRDMFLGSWDGDGYFGEFSFAVKENGKMLEGYYTTNPGSERLPYRAQRIGDGNSGDSLLNSLRWKSGGAW